MKLTKRTNDVSLADRRRTGVDSLFDEMWRDPFRTLFRTPSLFEMSDTALLPWHPSADIEETDDAFVVSMDLPGISKKNVHVDIADNILTIRGERERRNSGKDDRFRVLERFYGKFERSFVLPKGVDSDSVDAQFKDGVLTIIIKKSEESKAREIAIR